MVQVQQQQQMQQHQQQQQQHYGQAGGNGGYQAPGGGKGSMQNEMRPGDWVCPSCGDHVFARNDNCRRCSTPKPADGGGGGYHQQQAFGGGGGGFGGGASTQNEMRPGDWSCPNCGDHVFARNQHCRRCSTARPDEGGNEQQVQPSTGKEQYFQQQQSVPAPSSYQKTMPGDWYCPRCKDLQFARNAACRMCATPKPSEEEEGMMAGGAEGNAYQGGSRSRSRSPYRLGA